MKQVKSRKKGIFKEQLANYLMLMPFAVLFILFVMLPVYNVI